MVYLCVVREYNGFTIKAKPIYVVFIPAVQSQNLPTIQKGR